MSDTTVETTEHEEGQEERKGPYWKGHAKGYEEGFAAGVASVSTPKPLFEAAKATAVACGKDRRSDQEITDAIHDVMADYGDRLPAADLELLMVAARRERERAWRAEEARAVRTHA